MMHYPTYDFLYLFFVFACVVIRRVHHKKSNFINDKWKVKLGQYTIKVTWKSLVIKPFIIDFFIYLLFLTGAKACVLYFCIFHENKAVNKFFKMFF